jgi:hypothetical protein
LDGALGQRRLDFAHAGAAGERVVVSMSQRKPQAVTPETLGFEKLAFASSATSTTPIWYTSPTGPHKHHDRHWIEEDSIKHPSMIRFKATLCIGRRRAQQRG